MGSIHTHPLAVLAHELARAAALRDFVETGTYLGQSLRWASHTFQRVVTIEVNAEFQRRAQAINEGLDNVKYVLGDSSSELRRVVSALSEPALFWLDAHAGGGFFAKEDNCPLVTELETVLSSPLEHCVVVDDARAFLAPPPPPFDYLKWPTLDEIAAVVLRRPDYFMVSILDVLIVAPKRHRSIVAEFCFKVRPRI